MLHINTINYEKPTFFPQNFYKIFRKNCKIFTKFSEKFQKKIQKFSEKIIIKPIYIVSILTRKFVNLQNLRAATLQTAKPLCKILLIPKLEPLAFLTLKRRDLPCDDGDRKFHTRIV